MPVNARFYGHKVLNPTLARSQHTSVGIEVTEWSGSIMEGSSTSDPLAGDLPEVVGTVTA